MDNLETHDSMQGIAIIGMAGRFPGAKNIEDFWQNLQAGVESISFFTDEELEDSGIDLTSLKRNPNFVKARGVLPDVQLFDASFFGFLPAEAEVTDPQHRVFMECSWEALESAGYDPESYAGSIGVYAGMGDATYFLSNLYANLDVKERVGAFQIKFSNEKDFLPTRVAYKLNLKGPCINVQTACSTSLVAVSLACQSLLTYQSDVALAGGVSISFPQKRGYLYQEGEILSPDGHCRAFDARARGTVSGEGVGIVVLKRLSEALADGDLIHAVIKSAAINNDGSLKVGYTAPSIEGQAEVIAMAHALAEVEAETISYVEAHGTGTPLGDPIEIAGLTQAFRATTKAKGFCAIGSLKTNIGHLDRAAGVAGLIKTVLALKHKLLPPSLHFTQPNPKIDFANSPFYVNTALSEWKAGSTPRRAGVSSFGLGGTNAHVILEEAPSIKPSGESRPWQLMLLSTKTDTALGAMTTNLVEHLKKNPDLNLADTAYTLQVGRRGFNYRRMLVCQGLHDAADALETLDPKRVVTQNLGRECPPIAFMFPGGGAQYVNMGADLYRHEPAFRELVDKCCELINPRTGRGLQSLLYPCGELNGEAAEQLVKPSVALPALFITEYSLAKLLISWGVQPAAMIGHSLGEYTAACLAGVLSLEDALSLVALRGRLFEQLPSGAMLSVPLPEKEARLFMHNGLSIAAINKPSLCVVSGGAKSVEEMERALAAKGVESSRLHISVGAHSEMVEPILNEFAQFVKTIHFQAPAIPYVSNVTGTWITAAEAMNPNYWVRHLRQTVRFSDGLKMLLSEPNRLLMEIGPGQTLSTFARQHPERTAKQVVLASLRHPKEPTSDVAFLLNSLGRLWLAGAEIDWPSFYTHEQRRRVVLPTYPFERKRYYIDPPKPANNQELHTEGFKETRSRTITTCEEDTTPVMFSKEPRTMYEPHVNATQSRKDKILSLLKRIIHDLSGVDLADMDVNATFLEMGFESLFLTRAIVAFQKEFNIKITFRQLFAEAQSLDALAEFINGKMPPEELAEDPPPPVPMPGSPKAKSTLHQIHAAIHPNAIGNEVHREQVAGLGSTTLERIIAQQLQVMSAQLKALRNGHSGGEALPSIEVTRSNHEVPLGTVVTGATEPRKPLTADVPATPETAKPKKPETKSFGPWRPIEKGTAGGLTPRQQKHLDALIARYTSRTRESKVLTQNHRASLADPRTVSGFRLPWKEMVYPIVATRSSGSRLWDVDGNEWVDLTMGFGINLFGHSPAFIVEAVEEQLKKNIAIGPQSPLAGKIAELMCEFTGMERVAFCNTGSEAVLAAIRVSRTVTGRNKIALFEGDYHGIFDEVLVKGVNIGGTRRSVPIAPGTPPRMVEDVLVLDYGNPESLDVIQAHASELAAVLVEPVQSRRPDLQPREFLHSLRKLTKDLEVPLIFDEVVTGFRLHPGGAQAWFGVQADLAAYGKAVSGGMPIGVVAGNAAYMDALDGGMWNYGDASIPEAGVTYFAGTFARHPLALAAAWSVLNHLKKSGPQLQVNLNEKTSLFANELNEHFERNHVPIRIVHFSSFFMVSFQGKQEYAGLFWHHLRDKGIHTHEGRPNFLSTAHTDEDMAFLVRAFKESAAEMRDGGFLPEPPPGPLQSGEPVPHLHTRSSSNLPEPLPTSNVELASPHSDARGVIGLENSVCEIPLTEAQMEIWLATRLGDDASRAFNLSHTLRLKGPLQLEAMRTAIQQTVDRHEAFRTTFRPDGALQRISPSLTIEIPLADLSEVNGDEREARVAALLASEVGQLFDLVNGPPVRVRIVRLETNTHLLLITTHHIICDGWSWDVLLRDLSALFSSACRGTNSDLPLPMQFKEYAFWQEQQRQSPDVAQAEAYWIGQFAEPVPDLELPTDRARPPVKTYNSAHQSIALDKSIGAELRRIGARQNCTLFSTLVAAFNTFLFRLTGQDDLVVGFPAAGQALVGGYDLVGHCVNLLPLRSRINGALKFNEYLRSVRKKVMDAYEHQNYTFGSLIRKLNLPRDPSRLPLVSVFFSFESGLSGLGFDGLDVDLAENPSGFVNSELFINVIESKNELKLKCSYNTDLFNQDTVRRWLQHFHTLLTAIVADPEQRIADLPLLTEVERRQLLVDWNKTEVDFPRNRCLQEVFEAQVERSPDAVAVIFNDQQLTYKVLNARANQLAYYLRRWGVRPEVLVGICMERSLEMLVGLLGILKAGGAYVPLDPTYPRERLSFMLEDAAVPVLLTQKRLVASLPTHEAKLVCLDSDWDVVSRESEVNPVSGASADNLAYVMYTSGSTGKPKGVTVPHRAVNRLVLNTNYVQLEPSDKVAQVSNASFDAATFEIWGALLHGARLVVISKDIALSPQDFAAEIRQHEISTLFLTTALFNQMASAVPSAFRLVRHLLFGGEAVDPKWVREVLRKGPPERLLHVYGPTESTTFATWHLVQDVPEGATTIPIGRPIANTQVYVLDAYMNPVPTGAAGDLHISGDGLARGYLNRPQLTAEKFIPNPFSDKPGARLYKTGDLARYLPDGEIEFLGRIDNQVKIRGFRIELGEVEAVLAQHPAVRECVIVAREDKAGDKRLVAYFVARQEQEPSINKLRTFLKQKLPEHMVPGTFVLLDTLPLTPNGKVDRRALPAPGEVRSQLEETFVGPKGQLQHQLTRIWEDLLGIRPIGIKDNFFDLGGHSLLAIRLMDRVEKLCGRRLPLSTLLAGATIEDMASALLQQEVRDYQSPIWEIQSGGSKRPFFFLHGDLEHRGVYSFNLARHLDPDQPVYAIHPHGFDDEPVPLTIEVMAADRLKTLRAVQPQGPYLLGGYCNGGVVAFEMARQLQEQGQQVELLVLIETSANKWTDVYKFLCNLVGWFSPLLRLDPAAQLKWSVKLQYYWGLSRSELMVSARRKVRKIIKRIASISGFKDRHDQYLSVSPKHVLLTPEIVNGAPMPKENSLKIENALHNYVPQAYSGRLSLILATQTIAKFGRGDDLTLGWGEVAAKVSIRLIPGEHLTCISTHVQILAESLKTYLREAEVEGFIEQELNPSIDTAGKFAGAAQSLSERRCLTGHRAEQSA